MLAVSSSSVTGAVRTQHPLPPQPRCCKVDACHAPLSTRYCRRYLVCAGCRGRHAVVVKGRSCRWCNQCACCHSLSAFDGNKRNCREKLSRIRQRRHEHAQGRSSRRQRSNSMASMKPHASSYTSQLLDGDCLPPSVSPQLDQEVEQLLRELTEQQSVAQQTQQQQTQHTQYTHTQQAQAQQMQAHTQHTGLTQQTSALSFCDRGCAVLRGDMGELPQHLPRPYEQTRKESFIPPKSSSRTMCPSTSFNAVTHQPARMYNSPFVGMQVPTISTHSWNLPEGKLGMGTGMQSAVMQHLHTSTSPVKVETISEPMCRVPSSSPSLSSLSSSQSSSLSPLSPLAVPSAAAMADTCVPTLTTGQEAFSTALRQQPVPGVQKGVSCILAKPVGPHSLLPGRDTALPPCCSDTSSYRQGSCSTSGTTANHATPYAGFSHATPLAMQMPQGNIQAPAQHAQAQKLEHPHLEPTGKRHTASHALLSAISQQLAGCAAHQLPADVYMRLWDVVSASEPNRLLELAQKYLDCTAPPERVMDIQHVL